MSTPTITWTTPKDLRFPLTVFYDHSCSLCRAEITHIKSRDDYDLLKLVDCSAAEFNDTALPVKRDVMMNCIHLVDANGAWLKATDVFVALYGAVGLVGVARFWRFTKPLGELIYPLVVRHRYLLSKLGIDKIFVNLHERQIAIRSKAAMKNSQACKDGVCEAPTPGSNAKAS